jgi:hypothetical protein
VIQSHTEPTKDRLPKYMQNDLLAQTSQPKNKPTGTAECFVTSLGSYLTSSK